MHYGLAVRVKPAKEPVTLDEAKAHLRVIDNHEDALIDTMVTAARERAEAFCNRSFITTEWTMTLDAFPGVIYLPRTPVTAVSAIRYLDDAGVQQTLATSRYRADLANRQARITPEYSDYWPSTYPVIAAVEVDFAAGWGPDPEDVPETVRQGIKLIIGHFYDYRATISATDMKKIPMSAEWLLGPHRAFT